MCSSGCVFCLYTCCFCSGNYMYQVTNPHIFLGKPTSPFGPLHSLLVCFLGQRSGLCHSLSPGLHTGHIIAPVLACTPSMILSCFPTFERKESVFVFHGLGRDSELCECQLHDVLASFPVPHPAFRHLQYRTTSDEKLGVGLGTRLMVSCKRSHAMLAS